MKTKIKLLDEEFELKSKLKEEGVKFPFTDEKDNTLHNKFTISISRVVVNKKITRRFYFYDSQDNYEKGIKDLNEETLKWAFRSILEDGLSATEDFRDFCSEFGYSTDSIRVSEIYKACQKTLEKLFDLWIFKLSDMLEELSKMGIE